jgi:hypothetical protein
MVFNQDGGQCVNRSIKIIIDYVKIVVLCELELAASVLEAALNGRFIVGSPGTEPVLEYVHVRHLDENEQGVGNFPSDLKPSLHVDHQNDAGSLPERRAHGIGWSSVRMAVDFGRLEQGRPELIKFSLRKKEVMASRKFTRPGRTGRRRDRNRQPQARPLE